MIVRECFTVTPNCYGEEVVALKKMLNNALHTLSINSTFWVSPLPFGHMCDSVRAPLSDPSRNGRCHHSLSRNAAPHQHISEITHSRCYYFRLVRSWHHRCPLNNVRCASRLYFIAKTTNGFVIEERRGQREMRDWGAFRPQSQTWSNNQTKSPFDLNLYRVEPLRPNSGTHTHTHILKGLQGQTDYTAHNGCLSSSHEPSNRWTGFREAGSVLPNGIKSTYSADYQRENTVNVFIG